MDIRSKKFRMTACCISSILFVAAAVVVMTVGCMLAMTYQLNSGWGEDGGSVAALEAEISRLWMIEVAAVAAAIVTLIIAIWMTGNRDETGKIYLTWFDRIFTDVQIIAGIASGTGAAFTVMLIVDVLASSAWYDELFMLLPGDARKEFMDWGMVYGSSFEPKWLEYFLTALCLTGLLAITLVLLLSIVKKLKAGCFWKNTIIGRFVCYLYDAAKASDAIFWKVMIVMIAGAILSATWILLIVVLVLIFIFVPRYIRKYTAVKEGVCQLKSGNLDYKIPVNDNGELDRLAMSINEISAATSIAVQNELKSQRMKTDLISNVSHDLKTPLTSMVSYVDLLKTEGLDSENAPQYLDIIEKKTRRLQKLTEDLFEAAKASSGAIPVHMERIEMTSIVSQALAEMEERLGATDLDVIFTNKAENVFVQADGQLLWRVIENLLVNVSKYALAGSRVYMDIVEKGDRIALEVKNISRERLNISADELMERFKRGDESRNTEGSGLGLSIAKDLTGLMDGEFLITIDGDLFKASVALKKSE